MTVSFDEAGQMGTMIAFSLFSVIPGALLYWLIATRFAVLNSADRRRLLPLLRSNPAGFSHSVPRRLAGVVLGVALTLALQRYLWHVQQARFSSLEVTPERVLLHHPFERRVQDLDRKWITATLEGFGEDACLIIQDGNGTEYRSHEMMEWDIHARLDRINQLLGR